MPYSYIPLLDLRELGDGDAYTLPAYRGIRFTLIPGSGATATYSYVTFGEAAAHDSDSSVAVAAQTTVEVAWPYVHISSSGGSTRVGLV